MFISMRTFSFLTKEVEKIILILLTRQQSGTQPGRPVLNQLADTSLRGLCCGQYCEVGLVAGPTGPLGHVCPDVYFTVYGPDTRVTRR